MNTKLISSAVFAVAALSGASAFAQNAQYGEAALAINPVVSSSTVTRAQVKADYLNARQNGAVAVSQEAAFAQPAASTSAVSRADVRRDALVAARNTMGGNSTM
ncbi:MAG: DUF4148 domain-containing protein [Pseudomonadota bacterium]|uniref:DUF4148 domain-containing protein n=1 Tax=Polaromonas aquatica TaxID=332657 RepID=A0ABW1TTY2_9BURK